MPAPPKKRRKIAPEYLLLMNAKWDSSRTLPIALRLMECHRNGRQEQIHYLDADDLAAIKDPHHRAVLEHLRKSRHVLRPHEDFKRTYDCVPHEWKTLLPWMSASGQLRCLGPGEDAAPPPLVWLDGMEGRAVLEIRPDKEKGGLFVEVHLRYGDQTVPLREVTCIAKQGWAIFGHKIGLLRVGDSFPLLQKLGEHGPLRLSASEQEAFLGEVFSLTDPPEMPSSNGLPLTFVDLPAVPVLDVRSPSDRDSRKNPPHRGQVFFKYGKAQVSDDDDRRCLLRMDEGKVYRRDFEAEKAHQDDFFAAGFEEYAFPNLQGVDDPLPEIGQARIPGAVTTLTQKGWLALYDGEPFPQLDSLSIKQIKDEEGFQVDGVADFGGRPMPVRELLDQIGEARPFVTLEGGKTGWLPEVWLRGLLLVKALNGGARGEIRFRASQAALLEALFEQFPACAMDSSFDDWRRRREAFRGIQALSPGPGFAGVLRPYQKMGLGWLRFLEAFGFGGCLADDMGLGKTIQALALIHARVEQRRQALKAVSRPKAGPDGSLEVQVPAPSLIVAPKSVTYNWLEETARFAPGLRTLSHEGADREVAAPRFAEYDLIVVSYGILRRDMEALAKIPFDYLILDEAQAIKNAGALVTQAACALKARHRLALTGTPVENSASDLWSIFEFLNPGMLGHSRLFHELTDGDAMPSASTLPMLRKALGPFILRRTKGEVARDLPEKTETTLYCELEGEQRKSYESMRDAYRGQLFAKVKEEGLSKSKMSVLTALLRLRQMASHPGLVDPARRNEGCPKFDLLLERLREVEAEGGKALVFSQFTSLLALLRERMDALGLVYAYLDGGTRDRKSRIDRFQADAKCPFFLISLKAGGQGLNLTAASYVFLLDPWWNPAVEAQAVDRAHRIGQTRSVFAYRLIAKDTIEERVAELQARKRALAEALISENGSLLREMTVEDLELLLS